MLSFPNQLNRIREAVLSQEETLGRVAEIWADTLANGKVVHVYANGHSRISVEELCVRMGALTGFHPLLSVGLTTFTDVVGVNGIRVNQTIEKCEGIAAAMLNELTVRPGEPLLVITATGTTVAAVDFALEFNRRYPDHPMVGLACAGQSQATPPRHSSGKNLWHVIEAARHGIFIDNGMPHGDLSVTVESGSGTHRICPLSSIGALTVIQSLNELTVRELVRRGVDPMVLRNMHIADTTDNYDEWLADQRRRYSGAIGPHPEKEGGE